MNYLGRSAVTSGYENVGGLFDVIGIQIQVRVIYVSIRYLMPLMILILTVVPSDLNQPVLMKMIIGSMIMYATWIVTIHYQIVQK
jgi:hypothetical protein